MLSGVPIAWNPLQLQGMHIPDLIIAFNSDEAAIIEQWGYFIEDRGKPPDFVLETASAISPIWPELSEMPEQCRLRLNSWLKACYWQPPVLRIKQRMELYAQVRTEREGRPFALGEDQAVMRSTYVASSMGRLAGMRKRASCPHSSSTTPFGAGRYSSTRTRSWTTT